MDLRPEPLKVNVQKICVFSCHREIPEEIARCLSRSEFAVSTILLSPTATPEGGHVSLANFAVYIIDGEVPSAAALLNVLLQLRRNARVLVLAQGFADPGAMALLENGVSGFVTYAHLGKELANALRTITAGGHWVPRVLLSQFVNNVLATRTQKPALCCERLEPEDHELLQLLLDDLSDEEIAVRMVIPLQAAKFRVLRVLSTFNVGRRADLILHWYQEQSRAVQTSN